MQLNTNTIEKAHDVMLKEMPVRKDNNNLAAEGRPIILQQTKGSEKWDVIFKGKNVILDYFPILMSQFLVKDLSTSVRQPTQDQLDHAANPANNYALYGIRAMAFGTGSTVGVADSYGRQYLQSPVYVKEIQNQFFVGDTGNRLDPLAVDYAPTNVFDMIVTLDFSEGNAASNLHEMGFVYGSFKIGAAIDNSNRGHLFNYFKDFSVQKTDQVRLSFGWRVYL